MPKGIGYTKEQKAELIKKGVKPYTKKAADTVKKMEKGKSLNKTVEIYKRPMKS